MKLHKGQRDCIIFLTVLIILYVLIGLYVNRLEPAPYDNILDTEGMSRQEIDKALRR